MTNMTASERIVVANLHELVADRYESQAAAAGAWGMDQSMLCRILNGERSPTKWVPRIAKTESLPEEWFFRPQLRIQGKSGVSSNRFNFSARDPVSMLLQLETYFADVPEGRAPKVVKVVMRTLLDEFFGEVHAPTAEWRLVMNRLDHFAPALNTRRRAIEKK